MGANAVFILNYEPTVNTHLYIMKIPLRIYITDDSICVMTVIFYTSFFLEQRFGCNLGMYTIQFQMSVQDRWS